MLNWIKNKIDIYQTINRNKKFIKNLGLSVEICYGIFDIVSSCNDCGNSKYRIYNTEFFSSYSGEKLKKYKTITTTCCLRCGYYIDDKDFNKHFISDLLSYSNNLSKLDPNYINQIISQDIKVLEKLLQEKRNKLMPLTFQPYR